MSTLFCHTKPDSSSGMVICADTSLVVFGFNEKSEDHNIKLLHLMSGVTRYIPYSYYDGKPDFYKTYPLQASWVIFHEDILRAIQSSSLVKASGNIDNLSADELTTLKQGVLLYKVKEFADDALDKLVNTLVTKINDLIIEKTKSLSSINEPLSYEDELSNEDEMKKPLIFKNDAEGRTGERYSDGQARSAFRLHNFFTGHSNEASTKKVKVREDDSENTQLLPSHH